MKTFLIELFKGLGSVIFSLVAPVLLVVGGIGVGLFGLYQEWSWLAGTGGAMIVFGVLHFMYLAGLND